MRKRRKGSPSKVDISDALMSEIEGPDGPACRLVYSCLDAAVDWDEVLVKAAEYVRAEGVCDG